MPLDRSIGPRSDSDKLARRGIPTYAELCSHFSDNLNALQYLMSNGVLQAPICSDCSRVMKWKKNTSYTYRCKPCGVSQSILKDTIFHKSKLPLNLILLLVYEWINCSSVSAIARKVGCNPQTASYWCQRLRILVTSVLLGTDNQIGGEDVEVQIDESKFGKRKVSANGRGHRVEGAWVFGGVELNANNYGNNKFFCVVVQNRTAETLLPIIQK